MAPDSIPRFTPCQRMQRELRVLGDQLANASSPKQARSLKLQIAEVKELIKQLDKGADNGNR